MAPEDVEVLEADYHVYARRSTEAGSWNVDLREFPVERRQ
jgi:hypothetical protein